MGEGVGGAEGSGFENMDRVTAVVFEGGAEVVAPETMLCPRGSVLRALVDNNKLSGGVNRVGVEVNRGAVYAVVGGDGGVGFEGEKVVKGEGSVVK
jgi:hypothetical protein